MDATKRPLLIPPEFSIYAEKHGIFQIYEELLKKLIIQQPEDPLQAIVNWLKEPEDVPAIFVLGPPGAGKRSISRQMADQINCTYLCKEDFETSKTEEELVEALAEKLSKPDCIEKGWILDGLPENRKQALCMQSAGIIPRHVVLLDAPDTVLIERVIGKRIDILTGDVYHATFHPPTSVDVVKRIKKDPNCSEPIMIKRLAEYHRSINDVLPSYQNIFKIINADQPKDDVFSQTLNYISMKKRNNAPHTPRVLLLGPAGSGKSVQAALLANKYQLVNVNFEEYVQQILSGESEMGDSMRPFVERGVKIPDDLLLSVLSQRLCQLDAVKRGWVLHGFPKTRNQVDSLSSAGHEPNRVIVLDIPSDTAVERLSLRTVDPVTGERYHLLYNPPKTVEIKSRLKTHPDDEEDSVLKKFAAYQAHIEDIFEYYSSAQHINGDQDLQSVFECIETIIINPLPEKFD